MTIWSMQIRKFWKTFGEFRECWLEKYLDAIAMPIHYVKWWRANIVLQWQGAKFFKTRKLQTGIQWCVVSSPWKCRFGIHEIRSDLSCSQIIFPSPWNSSHHVSALHLGAGERAPGSTFVLNWVKTKKQPYDFSLVNYSWGAEANPWPWLACCQGSKAFGLYESNAGVSVLKKYLATGYLSWCQALIVGLGFQKALGFRISC